MNPGTLTVYYYFLLIAFFSLFFLKLNLFLPLYVLLNKIFVIGIVFEKCDFCKYIFYRGRVRLTRSLYMA